MLNKILTTFHVLAHEGCHQFFDLAFPGFYNSEEMPAWFSEGLLRVGCSRSRRET